MKISLKKSLSALFCALLLGALSLSLTACGGNPPSSPSASPTVVPSSSPTVTPSVPPSTAANPRIVITLADGRTMTAELYPEIAPITVARILAVVDQGLYDGVLFHRVIENMMIQTGGFIPGESGLLQLSAGGIYGEFLANGWYNPLQHVAGVLSMARATDYNSGGAQFFICTETRPQWDGYYAAFGRLVDAESLAVAIDISKVPTGAKYVFSSDAPLTDVIVASIRRA